MLLTTVKNQAVEVGLAAFSIAMALDIPMLVHKMRCHEDARWDDWEKLSELMYKEAFRHVWKVFISITYAMGIQNIHL